MSRSLSHFRPHICISICCKFFQIHMSFIRIYKAEPEKAEAGEMSQGPRLAVDQLWCYDTVLY